jgi:two-component system, NtrC family, nitrogen regulation sensor histidine kinase NtrY
MRFKRRFLVGLAWRVGAVLVMMATVVAAFRTEGLGVVRLVALALLAAAIHGLWRHVQRTNLELARFVDAVRFGDLSQSFGHGSEGSGFGEVGAALEQGIRRLRDERHRLTDASRFYEAVLDDAPIILLTIDGEGRVELANKTARRMLTRHEGIRAQDYAEYGEAFARCLTDIPVGRSRIVPLVIDSDSQAAMISAAQVHRLGGKVRVIAVQPIQGELNAVELAAQSDLVRVLTHEIMNSITPVTSLAHSAAALMKEADCAGDPLVADARAAVETLARRADGVMHFVESYRQISRTPEVRRVQFEAAPWAREIAAIFRASEAAKGVAFDLSVDPETLTIDADPDLLSQVLINLLKNAGEAARAHSDAPAVWLRFHRTRSGRARIEVEDNGAGVPEQLRQDVFLPFFTTKATGTGVGLSLARQIMLAHRGSIALDCGSGGGALFRLLV